MISTRPDKYSEQFPHFSKPLEIGHFSVDKQGQCELGKAKLKVLYNGHFGGKQTTERLALDLSHGYSDFLQKDPLEPVTLDKFLHWIRMEADRTGERSLRNLTQEADFISWRGTFTRIAASPYENREGWKFACIKFRDTVFICEFYTNEKIEYLQNTNKRQELMTYWGYKFEQYCTLDSEEQAEPNTSEPVNNFEQYCLVVRTRLGGPAPRGHRLVYAGETDCIDPTARCYIELKTQREFDTRGQENNFYRHKALKWWLQSFLVGIPRIVVGYRDDGGFVRKVKSVEVKELASRAKDAWCGSVCFNFLDSVLTMIGGKMADSSPDQIFLLEWKPSWQTVSLKPVHPKHVNEYNFLPEWFRQMFDNT